MERTNPIPGYTYGQAPQAPYGVDDLLRLQKALLWTEEDDRNLRELGDILEPQLDQLLDLWYGFVGSHPHLVYYFTSNGEPNAYYLQRVRERFGQWVLDVCRRPKDQTWLNYQWEIGRRHHTQKNKTDHVSGSPTFIHLRYMIAFIFPITYTVRDFIQKKVSDPARVDKLYTSWFKAVVLSVALWCEPWCRNGEW